MYYSRLCLEQRTSLQILSQKEKNERKKGGKKEKRNLTNFSYAIQTLSLGSDLAEYNRHLFKEVYQRDMVVSWNLGVEKAADC